MSTSFGAIHLADGSTAQKITTTPAVLTGFATKGEASSEFGDLAVAPAVDPDQVVVLTPGYYAVDFRMSASMAKSGEEVNVAIYKSSTKVDAAQCKRHMAVASEPMAMGLSSVLQVTQAEIDAADTGVVLTAQASCTVSTILNATPVSTTTPGDAGNDEVQRIAKYAVVPDGGTFTLTINIATLDAITTAPLAFNAGAAAIEAAIDAACTAAEVPSWTDSDISVAVEGGKASLVDGYMQLTFDGASVAKTNQGTTVINVNGAELNLTPIHAQLVVEKLG